MDESGSGKGGEVSSLVSSPGLRLLVDLGDGPIRGMWRASNARLFVVSGDTLYELDSDFVQTSRGTLNSSTGNVSIADNGTHLIVVDGTDGYGFTFSSNVFAEITDEDFPGADQVTFLDGYFIFNRPDTGQFFISGLTSLDFDGLDIASSEGNPDNIVGLIADHRDLWIFNENTTEVFFNSGDADFPFQRIQGAFIEHGCAAAFSIAKMNNAVFWLGKDDRGHGVVYMASGYAPTKISTTAVDIAIQGYGDISDATAYAYQQDGHHFYALNFTSANTTWVFDTSSNLWHERSYFDPDTSILARHRGNFHAFAFNKHVIADYANGNIYQYDNEYYYDDVDGPKTIIRQRVSPHVSSGLNRVFYSSFQLDMETGVGDGSETQGANPQVVLQFSDDSGRTWSNEKLADIGAIGETKKRVIWRKLGASRDRVWRVTVSDPVKVILLGAELQFEGGAS